MLFTRSKVQLATALFSVFTISTPLSYAEPGNRGRHQGPPPEAVEACVNWQLPDIKQLYSLIVFTGLDPSGYEGTDTSGLTPFIDTGYFDFAYGDTNAGERIIDSQYASSTLYVGDTDIQLKLDW